MVRNGAEINVKTEYGQTPLTLCVLHENILLARLLINRNADMFNSAMEYRDNSPFLVAIRTENMTFIELFCDSGAVLETCSSEGLPTLLYSFFYGFDDLTMYLALRQEDCDIDDEFGINIFTKYLMKHDV